MMIPLKTLTKMMMEIKFRAWHSDYKKMELPEKQLIEDIDSWDGVKGSVVGVINSYLKYGSDRVFMQYTGLKDKDDKEIYEGDIMLHKGEPIDEFDDGVFVFIIEFEDGGFWNYDESIEPQNCLIIGNIYQNPSLIKSADETN